MRRQLLKDLKLHIFETVIKIIINEWIQGIDNRVMNRREGKQ
jgi:hypothetical protein